MILKSEPKITKPKLQKRLVISIIRVFIQDIFKKWGEVRAVKADYWVICYLNKRCNVNHLLLQPNKNKKLVQNRFCEIK